MAKLNFQQSLLQSSVARDLSEIILICWFGAQEKNLIIFHVENSCIASYFSGFFDKQKVQKDIIYLNRNLCNIINAFYCHFWSI